MQNVDDPVNNSIRSRIRRIRRGKSITVRQAAILCDIPESSYSCMENGFYRISLYNLSKILSGLGASIEEVWPSPKRSAKTAKTGEPADLDAFRFNEVFRLSDATKAALFKGCNPPTRLYSINLDSEESLELAELIEVGLQRDWTILSRRSGRHEIHLCLYEATLKDHVKRIIDVYLNLWLASQMAEPATPSEQRGLVRA